MSGEERRWPLVQGRLVDVVDEERCQMLAALGRICTGWSVGVSMSTAGATVQSGLGGLSGAPLGPATTQNSPSRSPRLSHLVPSWPSTTWAFPTRLLQRCCNPAEGPLSGPHFQCSCRALVVLVSNQTPIPLPLAPGIANLPCALDPDCAHIILTQCPVPSAQCPLPCAPAKSKVASMSIRISRIHFSSLRSSPHLSHHLRPSPSGPPLPTPNQERRSLPYPQEGLE